MPLFHLILLSLIQGITEFLPISSSAHLILVPEFLQQQDQGIMIDVAAHGGTLLAVCLYFFKDTYNLFIGFFDFIRFKKTSQSTFFAFIATASIPGLLTGACLYFLDDSLLRKIWIIATASISFGLLLWLSDQKEGKRNLTDFTWKDVLLIGASQALAFIPGTSRSGITMTTARFLGITRTAAAKFSMLLSIPLIAAALCVYTLKIITDHTITTDLGLDFIVVFGLSFTTALFAIHLLLKWISQHSFTPFVVYRVTLGLGLFIWLFF